MLKLKKKLHQQLKNSTKKPARSDTINKDAKQFQAWITQTLGNSFDFYHETVQVGSTNGYLYYLTTMTNTEVITEKITQPLSSISSNNQSMTLSEWKTLCHKIFGGTQHHFVATKNEVVTLLMKGYLVIHLDGMNEVIVIKIRSTDLRSIEEPSTQTIIRGPKEGFIENLDTNINLVRRRIKNPKLRFEEHVVGSETSTGVALGYLEGVANSKIVEEVRKRITDIQTNAIFESANIEEFITDKTLTPFPLLYNTERPDTIAAHILSGKVAIFVDGSPFVLSAPTVLNDFIATSEDYYLPYLMGTFLRLLRYLAFFISLLLPAFYVGIITYHHEMIPTDLIISIISQREGVPFPALVEAILMEIAFEILREAGIRMPRAVGGTISIVGGLVIGQAAVEAGLVSNIMVIVVSLTAISSFVSPIYSFSIAARLLRFVFIILAGIFGFYGILLGLIMMVAHLASLRSFGIAYLSPYAPFFLHDHEDTMVRVPIWMMRQRPKSFRTEEANKQPNAKSPSPPSQEAGS
ncbi:spore germination protein [Bacillus alkalicellulosilyticus]|uniref:spore germination protein n=1 Tax=Alkalihalobacterium alkalicellulosilyticum TaxID=1912214 RepID=UPI0009986E76|nr:spore germination protein [Bacillus alkalicellulosilyticus]